MATNDNRVASWYWIISAILTPFVLIATVLWAFYAQQVQSYRAEGVRLVSQVEEDHKTFDPVLTHMKSVAEVTGFQMGDPLGNIDAVKGSITRPNVFSGENERTAPAEKRSPLLNAYLDAESRFYGASEEGGYVHDYAAAREWLNSFERKLQRYVYLKGYQYYTVKTIDIGGGDGVAVAEGKLDRELEERDTILQPPEAALEAANSRHADPNNKPSDKVMQEPTKITLELIFRKQTQLIRDLVSANLHQYSLLFADVAGDVEITDSQGRSVTVAVGFKGENDGLKAVLDKLATLSRRVGERKGVSIDALNDAGDVAENAITETNAKENRLQFMVVAADGRIEELQNKFENEKLTHEGDAGKYEDLIRNLPRLKIPVKLDKSDPDGEVSYSDYARGVTHINLGYSDGVRIGQRFEVWRLHGFEKDEFVGVVEIVRMLSAHYSLCTVLSLSNDNDPVRKGDQIVSALWHNGKFLTVALHGTYEPPNEAYSKERLTELLKEAGVRIVDKVQPGTDVVILGSNLLGDEWYRRARSDLRFDTLKEDDVRLYVDPR
ncbi:MAG: hypothetical protein KDB90_09500 [Planctomycetes bacterium]|nr:hypothetical protein [Planctomycetota bacterium]